MSHFKASEPVSLRPIKNFPPLTGKLLQPLFLLQRNLPLQDVNSQPPSTQVAPGIHVSQSSSTSFPSSTRPLQSRQPRYSIPTALHKNNWMWCYRTSRQKPSNLPNYHRRIRRTVYRDAHHKSPPNSHRQKYRWRPYPAVFLTTQRSPAPQLNPESHLSWQQAWPRSRHSVRPDGDPRKILDVNLLSTPHR